MIASYTAEGKREFGHFDALPDGGGRRLAYPMRPAPVWLPPHPSHAPDA